jgi:hypothetical protein
MTTFVKTAADLPPSDFEQALRDVRNGIKGPNEYSVDERYVRLREHVIRKPIRLKASIRDPE